MSDRSIASRPSLEQMMLIVEFMEKHLQLGLGKLRGLEGRDESKRLWLQLTRIVNNAEGPTRPMKSWVKFWADKKTTVRSKVLGSGGDPNNLTSNVERRIWDLFLANNINSSKVRASAVKQETHFLDENFFNEDSVEDNTAEPEPEPEPSPAPAPFGGAGDDSGALELEDREMAIMEKLMAVMRSQASALAALAHAAHAGALASERLADAAHTQARAIDRLANTFENIGAATHDVRSALVDIDATMKRYYSAPT